MGSSMSCEQRFKSAVRVLYFTAFVYHSLSCETPLKVYVAINGDNGDVYAGKCSCVSG